MRAAARLPLVALLVLAGCARTRAPVAPPPPENIYTPLDPALARAYDQVQRFLAGCRAGDCPVELARGSAIDTLLLDPQRALEIHFNDAFAHIPFRVDNTARLYESLGQRLGDVPFTLYALGQPVEELVPNFFRSDVRRYDRSRMPRTDVRPAPLVRRLDAPWRPTQGLSGRYIALWHSHGWYYEAALDRWEWQRARTFQTVEDLLPMAFTLPYLAPMLENAGAHVFFPRERDVQRHMAVVDNDRPGAAGTYAEEAPPGRAWQTGTGPGFAIGMPPYGAGENPFRQGTYRTVAADTAGTAQAVWTPALPESGDYAVYVSYASLPGSVSDARYTVHHAGGKTHFAVNQQIGGGTWIYLGTFRFEAGADAARVVLTSRSDQPGVVTADAVRFGGGMGLIARGGRASGRPRFVEAARYHLQYAGMPDTLVYGVSGRNDYTDDYQGRGEWVNYLVGAPFGPNKARDTPGLGIPVDLSLAFHTDAGLSRNDTTIGTLMIYSSDGADSTRLFPDGMSRFANRDFGDLLQTQVVADIRARYDPAWTRRSIWDRDYSEAYRPNVPSALLELLAHQNFLDMKFALDPRFRFDASRAIYKAMLRFIATQHGEDYVVQPLPPTHVQAVFTGSDAVTLRWQPQPDPLEPTATPTGYIVYTRTGDGGFDDGVLVDAPSVTLDGLAPGVIYSYKVTAVNAGGESFPSEILAVCRQPEARGLVLIVNGFDRIAPPATLETESYLGFANFWDQGVPDRYDLNYTGAQFNFDPDDPWRDDDAPGHGASYGNFETTVIAGNTFDFPYVHGAAIRAAGFSFASASDEAVMDGQLDLTEYAYVDLILGEEKATPWPKPKEEQAFEAFPVPLRQALTRYAEAGGRLFVSGAYIATDLLAGRVDADTTFAGEILGYRWRTDHAARTGGFTSAEADFLPRGDTLTFNTTLGPHVYAAEAPDALEPAGDAGEVLLRYAENNLSAAVGYRGAHRVVAFGFPFETIVEPRQREVVMQAVLDYLSTR